MSGCGGRAIATVIALLSVAGCGGELDAPDASKSATPNEAAQPPGGTPAQIASASQRCDASALGPPLLRRLTRRQIENTLRDIFPAAGSDWPGFALNDLSSPLGFSNDAAVLVVSPQTAREYLASVERLASVVTGDAQLATTLPCAGSQPDDSCAAELVRRYGRRLFRRTLAPAELDRYQTLFRSVAAASNFSNAAKWTLVALMQSPHMLYRRELGSATAGATELRPDEIASELAYTFTDNAPSPELLDRAERGELNTPEARVLEARHLLATDPGKLALQQFFREWLRYDAVSTADRPGITGFSEARPRMLEETQRFVEDLLFVREGGVRELLTAGYTFADRSLGEYYGLSSAGDSFAKIARPSGQGVGILAQGALLASSSNMDASSPTRRGLLIAERLLCRPRPSPPANVPPLGSSAPGSFRTTREHYENAHAQGACAACHGRFDPLGFAFEHFDQGGRYRSDEAGQPIDASGRVLLPSGDTMFEFDGQEDFASKLAERPEVADCISGLMAAYAFGGGGGEPCLAERARAEFAAGDYSLLEYMAQLAASPHFSQRSTQASTRSPNTNTTANTPAATDPQDAPVDAGVAQPSDAATLPAPNVTAQYAASNSAPDDNVIGPSLQLTNAGTSGGLELGSIELRYYFSNERAARCPDGCKVESYYAGRHPSGANVTANRAYVAAGGSAAYLSITFQPGTPALMPGEAIELQQQFHTEPYETFDESDDYSFDPTQTSLADSTKVTVYQHDVLIWGSPPP